MKAKKIIHDRFRCINHTVETAVETARLYVKAATNGFKPFEDRELYNTNPIGPGFVTDFDKDVIYYSDGGSKDLGPKKWKQLADPNYDTDWGPVVFLDKYGHIELDYFAALEGRIHGTAWTNDGDYVCFDDEAGLARCVVDLKQATL